MKAYLIRSLYDDGGDTVFRSVGVAGECRSMLTRWYLFHSMGRNDTREAFGKVHFEWRDLSSKPIADFPSCTVPDGVWSVKAVEVLGDFLRANGDLHPLMFEDDSDKYMLYDCWSKFSAQPNEGFSSFVPTSLKSIAIGRGIVLPDIFSASIEIGLMVSERFKEAAEAAGLTGMVFTEVEVIRND
ncbi:MAG: hypothetical protein Q8O64_05795 [Sideroxyarcus sp.]|nr:hypothetical protein [Sideroxyarcus sp.]